MIIYYYPHVVYESTEPECLSDWIPWFSEYYSLNVNLGNLVPERYKGVLA